MTKIKRIMAGCMAAICVAGSLCTGAYAADDKPTSNPWTASQTRYSPAPTSIYTYPDEVEVWHKAKGATASVSGITHTLSNATGRTDITCKSHGGMDSVTIYDYNYPTSRTLKPNVGEPKDDTQVIYTVTAITNNNGDTFKSKGNISKIW